MTLRELLKEARVDEVFKLINKKDSKNAAACDRPTLDKTKSSYAKVIAELMGLPKAKAYKMSWVVKNSVDFFDKTKYVEVCFLNHDYVEPKKGLKPWGCSKGETPPKGYYNVNEDNSNKYFAAGMTSWNKIIDTPIINEGNFSPERLASEVLWEITFYGWSNVQVKDSVKELQSRLKKGRKEIKDGDCITLPPKKKGGYKIIIAKSVIEDLKNISKKSSK